MKARECLRTSRSREVLEVLLQTYLIPIRSQNLAVTFGVCKVGRG